MNLLKLSKDRSPFWGVVGDNSKGAFSCVVEGVKLYLKNATGNYKFTIYMANTALYTTDLETVHSFPGRYM